VMAHAPGVSQREKPAARDNVDGVHQGAAAGMIRRGVLGALGGHHLVPGVRNHPIQDCDAAGHPVSTASEMLEGMSTTCRPTRAEASDVANAVWDGTDVVMLSGETASGKYPLDAITIMGQIVEEAEKSPRERPLLRNMDISSVTASVQVAASIVAEKTHARWIISITEGGKSCLRMTRFRPKTEVLGATN